MKSTDKMHLKITVFIWGRCFAINVIIEKHPPCTQKHYISIDYLCYMFWYYTVVPEEVNCSSNCLWSLWTCEEHTLEVEWLGKDRLWLIDRSNNQCTFKVWFKDTLDWVSVIFQDCLLENFSFVYNNFDCFLAIQSCKKYIAWASFFKWDIFPN